MFFIYDNLFHYHDNNTFSYYIIVNWLVEIFYIISRLKEFFYSLQ